MSSKRMPTEPSYFIPLILRSVKAFFGIGSSSIAGDRLRESLLKTSATEVFDSVCQKWGPLQRCCGSCSLTFVDISST